MSVQSPMLSSTPSSVSALLPAWQAAGFIQPTLDCLSAQTHPRLQVIVSVDLSDDDTFDICAAHAARDARFTVLRQSRRLGYVGNCNFLLGQAVSDHVLFAFHDDVLKPKYVECLSAMLDKRPEAVMAFSDLQLTHVGGKQEQVSFTLLEGVTDRVKRGQIMVRGKNNWWVPNRGVFRLERTRRIGGLKTHGAGEFSADWPWLFHMSLLGEFARVPLTLCHKFYRPGSLSRTWKFDRRQYFEVRAACMRELWDSELTSEEKLRLAIPLINWIAANVPAAAGGP